MVNYIKIQKLVEKDETIALDESRQYFNNLTIWIIILIWFLVYTDNNSPLNSKTMIRIPKMSLIW